MGKEIRVGLSVVGILVLLFCVLLYGRLSRPFVGPPDVFIEATSAASQQEASQQPATVRGQPTIVRGNGYEEPTLNPRLQGERQN
jgi:hypothetical protein